MLERCVDCMFFAEGFYCRCEEAADFYIDNRLPFYEDVRIGELPECRKIRDHLDTKDCRFFMPQNWKRILRRALH